MGSVICSFISIQKPLPTSFQHIRCDIQNFLAYQLNTPLVIGATIRTSVPVESNQAWPVAALLHASIALTFGHWLFENNLNYYYLITWSATSKLRSISSCFFIKLEKKLRSVDSFVRYGIRCFRIYTNLQDQKKTKGHKW